jgi:putative restriction endonuclease
MNWERIGWKVRVQFVPLKNLVRPKDHMDVLGRFLPAKYSPLLPNGNGLQSVYLSEVGAEFATVLAGLKPDWRSSSSSTLGPNLAISESEPAAPT